jgi:hypothetical protein
MQGEGNLNLSHQIRHPSATSNFESGEIDDSTYLEYIWIYDLICNTGDSQFGIRWGAGSYGSSGDYHTLTTLRDEAATDTLVAATNYTGGWLTQAAQLDTGGYAQGWVRVVQPANNNRTLFEVSSIFQRTNTNMAHVHGVVSRSESEIVDQVQFLVYENSATLTGTINMYGRKKS